MFQIGDFFDLVDSAVARVGLIVIGLLTVLGFALEAGGLLDLSGMITSFPLLALGGGLLGSGWVGTCVAAWLYRESAEGERPVRGPEDTRAPDAHDHSVEEPSTKPRRSFCDRISAGRLVVDEIRRRGDF